jgi:integrase
MVRALPDGLKGTRDRAILLLGFAGAFRRSEIVGLDVADLAASEDGLTVTLRRSKTDQEGVGRRVGIPRGGSLCPVRAVQDWLAARGEAPGPLFVGMTRHGKTTGQRLDGKDIATLIKRAAEAVGLDPATVSGHSLRAGLVTTAARAGKSERSIMGQTGHRSVTMVRRYIRDAGLFDDNAADGIGL